jgi:hypothetical protein
MVTVFSKDAMFGQLYYLYFGRMTEEGISIDLLASINLLALFSCKQNLLAHFSSLLV